MKLAVFATHPVQYYAPLFRVLATKMELCVFYHKIPNAADQGIGFGTQFKWDIDLLSGYEYRVLEHDESTGRGQSRTHPMSLSDYLDEGVYDVALSLGWYSKFLRKGIGLARSRGIPVMIRGDSQTDPHQPLPKRIVKQLSYPILLRMFSAGLFVGKRSREYFESFGFPKSRLFYSPHAIETERFEQAASRIEAGALRNEIGAKADEKLLLFAGKLVDFKRPHVAVDTAAALRRGGENTRLIIAGTGVLEPQLISQAEQLDVPLSLLGFVNQSRMPEIYTVADALILPSSRRETWGLVANEALASGTPIVVSKDAGCSADLCDGVAGLTGDSNNAETYAAALRQLWSRGDLSPGIKAMSDRHSLEAAATGILEAAKSLKGG